MKNTSVIVSFGFWSLLSLGALGIVWVLVMPEVLDKVKQLSTYPRLSLSSVSSQSGPAIYKAKLEGAPGRVTPQGEPSAIWVGWIKSTRHAGKSSTTSTLCWLGEVDNLSLREDSSSRPLSFFQTVNDIAVLGDGWFSSWETSSGASLRWEVPSDLGPVSLREIPPLVQERCSKELKDVYESKKQGNSIDLAYYQASLPPLSTVELAACQNGEALTSCSGSFLSRGGVHSIASAWSAQGMILLRIMVGVAALCLSIMGFTALKET